MKHSIRLTRRVRLGAALALLIGGAILPATALDLLQRYPTTLTAGLVDPGQARPWQFLANDIFHLSKFQLQVGGQLKLEIGPAELGIGHCSDGAVCAILIPAEGGKLTRSGGAPETVAHVWLRFHPAEINKVFPPETVSAGTSTGVFGQMRAIIGGKFRASYHAGMNAMIPEPKDMTVDVDTTAGVRRFFMVDTQAATAQYVNAFERQPVRLASAARTKANAPKILFTKPANGAKDVDPGLTEITVTFDQDMDEGMSWTGGGPEYPACPAGKQAQWRGKRTCVLPVTLQPGHQYRVGINSPSYRSFCSVAGQPAEPSSISFTTK